MARVGVDEDQGGHAPGAGAAGIAKAAGGLVLEEEVDNLDMIDLHGVTREQISARRNERRGSRASRASAECRRPQLERARNSAPKSTHHSKQGLKTPTSAPPGAPLS